MSPAPFSEPVDRRVLGGFVLVDAITNASVSRPMAARSTQLRLAMNRSGVYAIFDAPGFTALTSEFIAVAASWPAAQSFELTVQDPSLRYLARRAHLQVPQPLATLAVPQTIKLYPTPAATVEPNWALIRASVTGTAGAGLPWALVQVIRSNGSVAATGVTDARGEALLAVPGLGVQVSAGAGGAVTENTIAVTVQAWFDPSVLTQPPGWISNPDDILSNLANPALKTGKMTGALGATQVLIAGITISV